MAAEASAPATFERQATGLVREAGWWDVLVYNLNFISIGLMAAFLFSVTIPFYPGVNVYLNELIAFAIVIPLSLVFAMFAAAMPRSGGDYVYVSRTLHPALGMMSSFNNTAWWFIYGGVPSAFFAQYGLGPFLRTVGAMSGSGTLTDWGNTLVGDRGTFIAGAILILALATVFSYSLHALFPDPERALPVRPGEHRHLDRGLRREEPCRRRTRDQLDVRRVEREERIEGRHRRGVIRPAKHDPADDLALPRARLQPVVRLHRRRGAAGEPRPAVVDAGRGGRRHRRPDAAHLGHAARRRVHAPRRARKRLRREPRALVHAGVQRDRRRRQRPDLDRGPDPGRVRVLELHVASGPDPERLAQPGRLRGRRRRPAPARGGQPDAPHAGRGDLGGLDRVDRRALLLRLHAATTRP